MRVAAAIVFALALSMTAACTGGTESKPAPPSATATISPARLPTPTGPSAIGRTVLHLVDDSRRDPWLPGQARELMVSMFYPAQSSEGEPAPYASATEVRLLLEGAGLPGDGAELVSAAATNSIIDAAPAEGSYPLVVLSPGLTAPRYTLTALAEEMASRGYVVAAVDHAGESVGTEFPGGRMSTCDVACEQASNPAALTLMAETRARDVTFLLDRITGPERAWPYARMIDGARIGMAGHSIGGAGTAATMAVDARVKAGVNMDGSFQNTVPPQGLGERPFMLLGADETSPGSEPSWDEAWARLHGWKRWVTLAGADHNSFIDTLAITEQLGVPGETALGGGRAVELTRTLVTAFFDQQLGGVVQPMLEGSDSADPEVRFNNL